MQLCLNHHTATRYSSMTTLDTLISLLLLAAIFGWLLKRLLHLQNSATSELTRPLTPKRALLKPLIYLWWLITGLWPERIETLDQAEHPIHHKLSIWVHRFALLLITSLFVAVAVDLAGR